MQVLCEVHAVHIDEACLFPEPLASRLEQQSQQFAQALKVGSAADSVSRVPLADVFSPSEPGSHRLHHLIDTVRDGTEREDLVRCLRQELLHKMARGLGCNKLLVGDCATQLAAGFVASLSKVPFLAAAQSPNQTQASWCLQQGRTVHVT